MKKKKATNINGNRMKIIIKIEINEKKKSEREKMREESNKYDKKKSNCSKS